MKQIASAYTYNKTTGVIVLTGVNIDRDQLLLIVNTTRNVTYYNFADSTTTLLAFTQGVNTSVTLATSIISASSAHTNADALTIYYDDQVAGSGIVTANVGLNELPYIKVNINVANASEALVSNVYLRRIGEYSYESITYKGGEDEAYLRVYLDNGDESTQRQWRLYSYGAFAGVQGLVALAFPQNAGSYNGNALPPQTGWLLPAGITGTLTISYEQPSIQPISGTVTATDLGVKADAVATTDTGTFSVIALIKRGLQNWTSLLAKIPTLVSGRIPIDGSGVTQPVSEAQPTGDYVINTGTAGTISLSGSVVTTAGFDAGTTADYVAVTLEGSGTSGAFTIDLSTDNVNWNSGSSLGVYYDIQANSATDTYSHKIVAGTLFGGTRSSYSGRFLVSCTQPAFGVNANVAYRYVRITSPSGYGSWRYKFSSYKSIINAIGLSNPGGLARVTGRVDVGCVSTLPAITATVTQATATNLRSASETYQGGTAVGSANPLQVTLANTGANATAVKIDGSAVTQPISGTVTIGSILDSSNQNIIQQGGGVRSVLRVRDNSGTYGDLQGSGVNVFNVPIYGTVTANTGLTQPLTNAELRATVVPTEVYTGGSAVGSSNALTIKTTNAYGSNLPTVVIGYNQTGAGVLQPSDTSGFPIRPSSSAIFPVTPAQGTTATNTGFSSIVSNQQGFTLVSAVAGRRVLTVFNEGTGVLYISAGAICTTTSYQVRLGAGDYWEAPAGQLSLAHTAVFGTIGSAKVVQVT